MTGRDSKRSKSDETDPLIPATEEDRDTVLVVDDQEAVCQLLSRYLSRKDFEIVEARSGLEALDRVREVGPTAIVTDIRMPDMDGMELLARIMSTDPDMIVIMTTCAPSVDLTIEALRAGASDFLPKPVDLTRLYESLRRGIQRRKVRLATQRHQITLEKRVRRRTAALSQALDELRRVNTQLKSAYEGSIELLRRTSAVRDDDTGAHLDRIRLFSGEVAACLGLSDDDVEMIRAASPMHDIGKIAIPDQILQKTGSLTLEEFETMKKHTLIGGRILGGYGVPIFVASEQIALTHHECWNGNGYPRGLAGNDIPVFGRIVAVVDVWDALTHKRCYKPAYSTEKSLELMEQGRGSQFDPDVLDAFMEALPRILEIEAELREMRTKAASEGDGK